MQGEVMMISWIKIEVILLDKLEIITLAKLFKLKDTDTIVGKLIRLEKPVLIGGFVLVFYL